MGDAMCMLLWVVALAPPTINVVAQTSADDATKEALERVWEGSEEFQTRYDDAADDAVTGVQRDGWKSESQEQDAETVDCSDGEQGNCERLGRGRDGLHGRQRGDPADEQNGEKRRSGEAEPHRICEGWYARI